MLADVVLHLHARLAIAHVQTLQNCSSDPVIVSGMHSSSSHQRLHSCITDRQKGSCRVANTYRTCHYTQKGVCHAASFAKGLFHSFDKSCNRNWHAVYAQSVDSVCAAASTSM